MATEADDSIPCYFKGTNETELNCNANTSVNGKTFTRGAFKLLTATDK